MQLLTWYQEYQYYLLKLGVQQNCNDCEVIVDDLILLIVSTQVRNTAALQLLCGYCHYIKNVYNIFLSQEYSYTTMVVQ